MHAALSRIRRLLEPADTRSDAELLQAFLRSRDEEAFAAILRRHGPLVLGVCRRLLGNADVADDAFQAAFIVLARRASAIRPPEALPAWLHGVAYRTALKARTIMHRRRRREKQVENLPERAAPATSDKTAGSDWTPILDQELDALPEKLRLPLLLCDLEGRSLRDVAAQLAIAPSTLFERLATARKKLAARLRKRGVVAAAALALSPSDVLTAVPTPLMHAALRLAGNLTGAGASFALTLAQGVLNAMFLAKLKTVLSGCLLVAVLGLAALWSSASPASAPDDPADKEPPKEVAKAIDQKAVLADAVRAAAEIKAENDAELRRKIDFLVSLARYQVRIGDKAQGKTTFQTALDLAAKLTDPLGRVDAESHIGLYQAMGGLVAEARATAAALRLDGDKFKTEGFAAHLVDLRGRIHAELASYLAKSGAFKDAEETAAAIPERVTHFKKKKTEKEIEVRDTTYRDQAWLNVAEEQKKAGKLDDALRSVRRIKQNPTRVYLFQEIALARAKDADKETARRLIDEFKEDLKKIGASASSRATVLADLQGALGEEAAAMEWIRELEPEARAHALFSLSIGLSRRKGK